MLDRESVIRRNALDYLDDLLIGGCETDLSDESKVQVAMFLIENLIPIAEEQEDLTLTALLREDTP